MSLPFLLETPGLRAYLLAPIEYRTAEAFLRRLAAEQEARGSSDIVLVLCEHPTTITVGRGGSAADVRHASFLIRSKQVPVEWVARGGGAIIHLPGQLAIYPVVPLGMLGWKVGHYVQRLQQGLKQALAELGVPAELWDDGSSLVGRTGAVAHFGIAVRQGATLFGAYLNVAPALGLFRLLQGRPGQPRPSSLVAERQRPVKMNLVRTAVVQQLAQAFGAGEYHLFTGHPWLR